MQLSFSHLLRNWAACVLTAVALLSTGPTSAAAGDLAAYSKTFQDANPHLRTAVAYLRTGNIDFAALELEAYLEKWQVFKAGSGETSAPISAARRDVATALEFIDAGKSSEAAAILARVRGAFRDMHRKNGLDIFADCIFDADLAAIPLWVNRRNRPNLGQEAEAARVKTEAHLYRTRLAACNAKAPADVAADPEFRRLMDGSLLSLSRIPEVVGNKDGGHLYRLLIELRAFARLLAFRYG